MSNADDLDLDALVEDAKRLGCDSPERVIDHLTMMIKSNQEYLAYRRRKGRTGRYNESVARDSVVLAMAIKMLQEKP